MSDTNPGKMEVNPGNPMHLSEQFPLFSSTAYPTDWWHPIRAMLFYILFLVLTAFFCSFLGVDPGEHAILVGSSLILWYLPCAYLASHPIWNWFAFPKEKRQDGCDFVLYLHLISNSQIVQFINGDNEKDRAVSEMRHQLRHSPDSARLWRWKVFGINSNYSESSDVHKLYNLCVDRQNDSFRLNVIDTQSEWIKELLFSLRC